MLIQIKKQFISDNSGLITNLAKLNKITFSNLDNNLNDNFIVIQLMK